MEAEEKYMLMRFVFYPISHLNNLLIPIIGSVRVGGSFAAAHSGARMSPEMTNLLLCRNTDLK